MSAGANDPFCKARTTPLCAGAPRGLDSLRQRWAAKHPAPRAQPSPGRAGPAVGRIACGEGSTMDLSLSCSSGVGWRRQVGIAGGEAPSLTRRPRLAEGRAILPVVEEHERGLADRVGLDPGRRGRTWGALHRAVSCAGQAPAGSTLPQHGGRSYTALDARGVWRGPSCFAILPLLGREAAAG